MFRRQSTRIPLTYLPYGRALGPECCSVVLTGTLWLRYPPIKQRRRLHRLRSSHNTHQYGVFVYTPNSHVLFTDAFVTLVEVTSQRSDLVAFA